MRALIVHCHPEPGSFNAALTRTARAALEHNGWTVEVSDLYGERFDPAEGPAHYRDRLDPDCFRPLAEQRHAWNTATLAADVQREIARLERADLVVFQFPLWWHGQPAMLKGWFDRVFVSGGLYTSRMRYERGYFRGKRALCSVTTGAPAEAFGPGCRGGAPDTMLWPLQYSLHYLGFRVLPPFLAHGVQGAGYSYRQPEALQQHLEETLGAWSRCVRTLDDARALPFPGWDDWDDAGRALARAS